MEIPTSEDFRNSGKELLDFSWDIVANLLVNLDEAEYFGVEAAEVSGEYWAASRRRLTTSLSILQQGVEFLLKGRIAEISPFLLLADPPLKWPSMSSGGALSFSQFRTIDSQDLIKVLETFGNEPIDDVFVTRFHELREKRNTIMHSVSKELTVRVADVVQAHLSMFRALLPDEHWPQTRIQFLNEAPEASLGAIEFTTNRICLEVSLVIELLSPSLVKEFFRINKKQRKYFCPDCLSAANRDVDFEFKLAELQPKGPKSTSLFCAICDVTHQVERTNCSETDCPGNVVSLDWGCLTCGS